MVVVREKMLSAFIDDETLEVYNIFTERATFGDFMFLNWQLITYPDDARTLAYVADKELDIFKDPVDNTVLNQYTDLGAIQMHLKHIELLQKDEDTPDLRNMAMGIQLLSGASIGYAAHNDLLPVDKKVSILPDFNFTMPCRIKDPDGFEKEYSARLGKVTILGSDKKESDHARNFTYSTPVGLNSILLFDPTSLGIYLEVLHKREPAAYNRFVNGPVRYADHLIEATADMKVGGIHLRKIVKDPLMKIIEEYYRAAHKLENEEAREKLTSLMGDILNGEAYVYGAVKPYNRA